MTLAFVWRIRALIFFLEKKKKKVMTLTLLKEKDSKQFINLFFSLSSAQLSEIYEENKLKLGFDAMRHNFGPTNNGKKSKFKSSC